MVPLANVNRETNLCLGVDPFWSKLAMLVTQDIVLRTYFRNTIVLGSQNLPSSGSLVLAPTHRSRWDALMLPKAVGRRVTGRDCRFMVTRSEMTGLQGWFLNRLGCFPVDQGKPSLQTLRYAVDLMIEGQQLVVFPEGKINRTNESITLHQGLIRLAQLACRKGVDIQVLPIGIGYSEAFPKPFGKAAICFEKPLVITQLKKFSAKEFNLELSSRMHAAEQAALHAVGRK